jgi:hypothetical protein
MPFGSRLYNPGFLEGLGSPLCKCLQPPFSSGAQQPFSRTISVRRSTYPFCFVSCRDCRTIPSRPRKHVAHLQKLFKGGFTFLCLLTSNGGASAGMVSFTQDAIIILFSFFLASLNSSRWAFNISRASLLREDEDEGVI